MGFRRGVTAHNGCDARGMQLPVGGSRHASARAGAAGCVGPSACRFDLAPRQPTHNAIDLLQDSTCRPTQGFAAFLARCRGVKKTPSSTCTWSTHEGSGQWVTVTLGEPKDGSRLSLPMMVMKARSSQETVLVALCSGGEGSELAKVERPTGN